MSGTNDLVERLTGFANGTFHYKAYRGKAPDGVPQLRSDILALVATLAPVEAVPVVKPLEWQSDSACPYQHAQSALGMEHRAWKLREDAWCWAAYMTLRHPTHSVKPLASEAAAKAAAQADFERRILSALAHPPAQAGAVTDDAVIRAGDVLMQHGINAPEQVIYQAARAALTAALGAQTPPEGARTEATDVMTEEEALTLPDANGDDEMALAAAPTPPVNQSEGADAETRRLALEEAIEIVTAGNMDSEMRAYAGYFATAIRALIDQPTTDGGKE